MSRKIAEAREKYESSFWLFCREIVGLPHLWEPLHKQVCDFLQGIEEDDKPYSCLLLARGHFKTTLASVAYPVWRLLKDPDLRILIAHGKIAQATKILREVKNLFEMNEGIRLLWPDVVPDSFNGTGTVWLADQIVVKRSYESKVPSIQVASTDAAMTGLHFDLIVHDDLVYKETVTTDEQRDKTKEYRKESEGLWESDETKVLNVGTRWHWDDAHQELVDGFEGKGDYANQVRALIFGCYDPVTGDPLFPRVEGKIGNKVRIKGYTRDDLERKRQRMGTWVFSCQFENSPRREEEGLFQRHHFKWFRLTEEGHLPTEKNVYFFTAIDPNRSEKTQNDPCVVLTCGVDHDGHMWVCDMSRGHPSGPQLVGWIRSHVQRWQPRLVLVETQNYQLQLCRWLKEDMLLHGVAYRIKEMERSRNSTKYERVTAMQPLVEAGGMHLREGLEDLITELEHFPDWKTDDIADALSDLYAHGIKARPPKATKTMPKNPFTVDQILKDLYIDDAQAHSQGRVKRVPALG